MEQLDIEGWPEFLKLCHQAGSVKQLEELFSFFLTIEEQENLTRRFLLVKALLEEKKTQREIAADLKISISKLTRGSNALKTISPNLRRFLEKSVNLSQKST